MAAAEGRCVGAHFGTYDYTAACRITAAHQTMTHPACEFAKQVMQVVLAGTGVNLSDGATNVMPVGPHRQTPGGPPLTQEQQLKNRAAVQRAWQLHFDDVRSSLRNGYYQGWDLHPAQLVDALRGRLLVLPRGPRRRLASAAAASWTRPRRRRSSATSSTTPRPARACSTTSCAASSCGAITIEEAQATGLTLDELQTRSFLRILQGRRALAR